MTLVPRIVTPTSEDALPVDRDAAKKFCRVDFEDDDAEIASMVRTAFDWLQPPRGCLAVSIAPQTLRVDLCAWPLLGITLPAGPVSEVASVRYYDEANAEQTLDAANYFIDNDTLLWSETFVAPPLYVRPSAVRIEYVAGPEEPDEPIRAAILRVTKQLYDYRDELVGGVSFDAAAFGVDALIQPYRVR